MLRVRQQQIVNQQHEHQRRRLKREAMGIDVTPYDPTVPPTGPETWFQGNQQVAYAPNISYGQRGHTAEPFDQDGNYIPPRPVAPGVPAAPGVPGAPPITQAGIFGMSYERLAVIGLVGLLFYSLLTTKQQPIVVTAAAPQGA